MGRNKNEIGKQGFLHGALILLVAVAIVKVIGFFFKIPLNLIIDEVGMSYFSVAYNLYNPIFSLATAGFPIAIARLVSESSTRGCYRDTRQIHRLSIPIFTGLGLAAFLLMFFGARPYLDFINHSSGDLSALPAIYVLSPAVFFCTLMAIYRGYYEGLSNMVPTALSEVLEAVFKLALGLAAAYFIVQGGLAEYAASGTVYGIPQSSEEYAKLATLPYAAGGAILGVTAGSAFGALFLFLYHKRHGDGFTESMLRASPRPAPAKTAISRLVRTAIPVALGSLAVNLSGLVDSTFVKRRLADIMQAAPDALLSQYGSAIPSIYVQGGKVPDFLFGCFANASTLFLLIPAVTQAFGVSALPSVTAAWTGGDRERIRRSIETVLRIAAFFTFPAGLGLCVLSGPVSGLLGFSGITGSLLTVLGLGAIFAAMATPINSMLQAVGRVDLPVKLLTVGLAVKVALNYWLVGIPEINVMGAGIGTLACYVCISVISAVLLCREAKIQLRVSALFLKPLLSSLACAFTAYWVQKGVEILLPGKLATLAALACAVLVYVFCMLWLRALEKNDVIMLPQGQNIAKILENHHWIG